MENTKAGFDFIFAAERMTLTMYCDNLNKNETKVGNFPPWTGNNYEGITDSN